MSAEAMLDILWRVTSINWRIAAAADTSEVAEILAASMEMLLREFTDDYPPIPYSTLAPRRASYTK